MKTALDWVRWWSHAWRDADPDWYPPALRLLTAAQMDALARGHHAALARSFGITPCMPPQPSPSVLSLCCGTPRTVHLACQLVANTCSPSTASDELCPQDRAWCERTAKALRPGHWLEQGQDSLALLRAWLGERTWERARLAFPRSRIIALQSQPSPQAPGAKLNTLWQSACWKAEQSLAPSTTPTETHDARPALA
ncbi:hypothetical protein YA0783_02785 [Pseudomonas corrugata]|jgi:hypothetical protein|uniref:hypothetical protein n=1 Tax=Pseudomonas corrugata TaxID=47879 RepID=UPI0018E624ED|nr:hypothetical protein [Pseudomonas corrugata]MBI6617215.1 hypothetical protein [Pseudomonas corrugata]MBI6691767.1 hypothetical protein [Pseudomonas corrugata]